MFLLSLIRVFLESEKDLVESKQEDKIKIFSLVALNHTSVTDGYVSD